MPGSCIVLLLLCWWAVGSVAMGRAICPGCSRPDPVCVCKALPQDGKIELRTKVMVVQHPCECKKKMIGTVPLMDLVLSNFELVVARGDGPVAPVETRSLRRTRRLCSDDDSVELQAINTRDGNDDSSSASSGRTITIESKERKDYLTGTLDNNRSLNEALADRSTLILYPGPGAVDIESLPVGEGTKPRTLVVIDGTWRQAGRVMREACIMRAVEAGTITRVQFANAGRSDYKFRKEPKKHCISSLESVAYCLRFLEDTSAGAAAVRHLLGTFSLMVSLQTSFISKGGVVRDVNREDSEDEDITTADAAKNLPGGGHLTRDRASLEAGTSGEQLHGRHGTGHVGDAAISSRAKRRPFALFRQVQDVRTGANRFVQDSEEMICTYDEAASWCRECNRRRKKGQRLTVLPLPRRWPRLLKQDNASGVADAGGLPAVVGGLRSNIPLLAAEEVCA